MLAKLQFWTLKDEILIPDVDIGCFRTYDKIPIEPTREHPYILERQEYVEAQNLTWIPRNKRPEKLRETLKDLEDLLSRSKCVALRWVGTSHIKLFLSSGHLVTIASVDPPTVDRILLDKYLVGKLASDHVVQVVMEPGHILASYLEPKLTLVYLGKSHRPGDKLSSLDPKVFTVDLPGPAARKLDHFLSVDSHLNQVAVWWPSGSQEAWPWLPFSREEDRANLLVYSLSRSGLTQEFYTFIDGDFIKAGFMSQTNSRLFTLVENTVNGMQVVTIAFHHLDQGVLTPVSRATVLLQDHILLSEWSPSEDHLVLVCKENSLVIYDCRSGTSKITKISLEASQIIWHPCSFIFLLANAKGQLASYDIGLTCLKFGLLSDKDPLPNSKPLDLSFYFRHQPLVRCLAWQPSSAVCLPRTLFLVFDQGGPFALLVLLNFFANPIQLVQHHLSSYHLDEAICLLMALNWNTEADVCFSCLNLILQHLFRLPLTLEAEAQLEATLGSFYSPGYELEEAVILAHRTAVRHLARRFFHVLLRNFRLERAFLLALDLKTIDLFMDLYHVAKSRNEDQLALTVQQHIEKLESEEASSCFTSSSSEVTEGDEEEVVCTHITPGTDPNEEFVDGDEVEYDTLESKDDDEHEVDFSHQDGDDKDDEEDLQIKFVHFGVV